MDVDLRELEHARVVACGGHARACRVVSQVLRFTDTKGYLTLIEFIENRGIFMISN